jgi:serine/threonine-protein kinase
MSDAPASHVDYSQVPSLGIEMAVSVEGFLKLLGDSGILSSQDLRSLQAQIPAENRRQDAQELAHELVRDKKLTPFQANALCTGKPQRFILGNYVLLEKIGAGSMGMVYKAEHRRMKRIVAIKVLPRATFKDPEVLKRFHREVEAAARLTHPNIVAAYDADEAHRVHFLAMEFVEGTDLARHVNEHGPMPTEKAIDCILQAARGLEHAHARGIIHRDVKPSNLLLDTHGTVKILDMGLARMEEGLNSVDTDATAPPLTTVRSVIGTVDFMSPEQAVDSRQASFASDVYSLGITFYFLLTAKAAYGGKTHMARILAHRDAPIPSLCAARPDVPPQIDAIFRRMVAKTKEARYASMTDVIRDLSNWQNVASAANSSIVDASIPQNVISAIFDD